MAKAFGIYSLKTKQLIPTSYEAESSDDVLYGK
jgi:hypothetical protein